jgi:hypothetical protein
LSSFDIGTRKLYEIVNIINNAHKKRNLPSQNESESSSENSFDAFVNYVLDSRLAIIRMKLNLHSNIFVNLIKLCFKLEDLPENFHG